MNHYLFVEPAYYLDLRVGANADRIHQVRMDAMHGKCDLQIFVDIDDHYPEQVAATLANCTASRRHKFLKTKANITAKWTSQVDVEPNFRNSVYKMRNFATFDKHSKEMQSKIR